MSASYTVSISGSNNDTDLVISSQNGAINSELLDHSHNLVGPQGPQLTDANGIDLAASTKTDWTELFKFDLKLNVGLIQSRGPYLHGVWNGTGDATTTSRLMDTDGSTVLATMEPDDHLAEYGTNFSIGADEWLAPDVRANFTLTSGAKVSVVYKGYLKYTADDAFGQAVISGISLVVGGTPTQDEIDKFHEAKWLGVKMMDSAPDPTTGEMSLAFDVYAYRDEFDPYTQLIRTRFPVQEI